ncbi:MAG: hypothetical protein JXR19_09275 [Bacteroidia bacterium]
MKKIYILICVAIMAFGCSGDKSSPSPRAVSETSDLSNSGNGNNGTGVGGSMARFTIAGDHLYIATTNTLYTFSLANSTKPELKSEIALNFFAETIFHINGTLLLGTQGGVMIYSLNNPDMPSYESVYQHIVSCDPVVASGSYAYSTLRTETNCSRGVNRLDVIDISDIKNPNRVTSFNMNNPKGLGIAGDRLFVCDGDDIKRYSLSTPSFPEYSGIATSIENCFDLIPIGDLLIVSSGAGIYQFTIESDGDLTLLSKIDVQ